MKSITENLKLLVACLAEFGGDLQTRNALNQHLAMAEGMRNNNDLDFENMGGYYDYQSFAQDYFVDRLNLWADELEKDKTSADTGQESKEQGTKDSGDTYNINAEHVSLGDNAQHPGRDINTQETGKGNGVWGLIIKIGIILGIIVSVIAIMKTFRKDEPAIEPSDIRKIETETIKGVGNINNLTYKPANRKTQLNARIRQRVNELYDQIDNEKLKPWVSMHTIPFKVTKHDGSVISCGGVRFEGSPRLVFWSDDFIPPILENAIVKAFDQTIEECRANGKDPKPHVYETNIILSNFIYKVYTRMASIDNRLSNIDAPEKVPFKDVTDEIDKMMERLKRQYDAALSLASG